MRLAVIDHNKCRYKKCTKPCISFCPRVRSGDETVVDDGKKIIINEELCIGCGICVNKCQHDAIKIINLSHELENMTHQYGKNTFRLYGLPCPLKGQVVGILGANGIGKSTALQILSGKIKPNLGRFDAKEIDNKEIISLFKGTEIQMYLTNLLEGKLKTVYKPQQVDSLPKLVKGTPRKILKDERGVFDEVIGDLGIENILDRDISKLSGGELQRMTIAAVMLKEADIYYFDEPSSYLDSYQRLAMAKAIRKLAALGKYVVVVEHDLATMDILADQVHIVHGSPGVYGVISML
ncbi:MAG: ATP-binding cassette domain-containing protein, partial [Candidatus Aenigmarchaeota archaeon]|nr:ATP-binding cassette domain-containing protein [Candidatus Aenigmarchaeota archaeon]